MDTVKRKINLKSIGVICTVVSWCLLFSAGILFINYEEASTSILYYFIYAIASLLTITGCVLLSKSSHETIIFKDKKEDVFSIFCLLLENASILFSTLIIELDLIYLFTSSQIEPLRAAAHIFICSFAFMLSGLLALLDRRIIWNATTILSFCIMALAVLYLGKALSGS